MTHHLSCDLFVALFNSNKQKMIENLLNHHDEELTREKNSRHNCLSQLEVFLVI